MKLLLLVCLLVSPCLAQKPDSRPAKRRQGGYLGLFISDATSHGQGVVTIDSVFKGSDAEKLGFRAGDKVVSVNGREIYNGDQFIKAVWMPGGGKGGIVVRRKGKEVKIKAGLKELDLHPKVGEVAPAFTLKSPDGKTIHDSAKLIGKQPLVLIFGSYT
jgi:S1-C subfamily serine protease